MADVVLFESPLGYSLFTLDQNEAIASSTKQFLASVAEFKKFKSYVSLFATVNFTTEAEALENMNAITEDTVHQTLETFLKNNLKKQVLGVISPKLASEITAHLGIKCHIGRELDEVFRGIRLHFTHFLKDVDDQTLRAAELGLGHGYSRLKVKYNVNKQDTMIVQAIFLLDQLEKDINTFTMRIKEWYSWHFPELYGTLGNDNDKFVKCVLIIDNRHSINDEKVKLLVDATDEITAQHIVAAARASMGFDLNEFDMQNVRVFAQRVQELSDYRQELQEYMHNKMTMIAPNLTALIGDTVGARLLSKAGSLINLAKYPASTVQILGAEKALFRAIKTRSNTPKYGVIYHSPFIAKADGKDKGRISRYLANKTAFAARIDSFREDSTPRFGEAMREQVEERLTFLKTGKVPQTNVDVMKQVLEELGEKRPDPVVAPESLSDTKVEMDESDSESSTSDSSESDSSSD